jgi:uncharacterized membrane protein
MNSLETDSQISTTRLETPATLVPGGARVISRMIVATLSLVGALISFYLLLAHLGATTLACPISGCDKVQASIYSSFLGVPVAAYGLVGFVTLIGLGVLGLSSDRVFGLNVQAMLLSITLVGVLAFVVLTYLELFVIHAVCMWCVISSLCMLGAFAASLWGWRARTSS